MSDPHVRELGRVESLDGPRLYVGVDYDSVVVESYRLTRAQAEEFAQLFISACWEASRCGIEQELEAR
ncbi:MAG TPA: hypothetical protein VNH17_05005 [Streptosporangiaceae bacterium]|nr:hypothetical protein [Streptosporangiaceae bacterium]